VNIGLFEATKKTGQALVKSFTKLLDKYGLRKKNIVYIKDEGSNLNAMTSVLKYIVNCDSLGLEYNFQGTCVGHVFSKACQYGIAKEKSLQKFEIRFH